MNWKTLLQSFLAAALGGAVSGIAAAAGNQGQPTNWNAVKYAAIGGAATGIVALLKQSPMAASTPVSPTSTSSAVSTTPAAAPSATAASKE